MWPSQEELDRLFLELDEDPDIAPDDRIRATAAFGVWKAVTLGAAVVAIPLGIILAAALMMWIDGGKGVAGLCGLGSVPLGLGLSAASYLTGRAIQVRYLRRALRRASRRPDRLMTSAGTGGSTSPVAVSAGRR